MILRNFHRLKTAMEKGTGTGGMTDVEGATSWYFNSQPTGANTDLVTGMSAQVGVGNLDPISYDDYRVGTGSDRNISIDSLNVSIALTDEGISRVFTLVGTHNAVSTGSDITIRRIGITKQLTDLWGSGSIHTILIAEMDLNEPVTVSPYTSFTVTFTWNEF